MKKILLVSILVVSVVFALFMYNKKSYVHSEAGFVASDSLTNLAFKIDGKIKKMTKEEGDFIKQNQLLASLQTDTLNTKLKGIDYKIKSLNHSLISLSFQKDKLENELNINKKLSQNKILEVNKSLKSLEYKILANEAKLSKLIFDKDKFFKLYKNNKISYDKFNTINTEYKYLSNIINSQKENLKLLSLKLNSAKENLNLVINRYKELDILDEKIETIYNDLLSVKQTKNEIKIKLKDSNLSAPFDGIIAKKFVNNDMIIKKGSFIYSLVNPKDIYIKVLLSEKKLSNIDIGSKAIIKLDAFDDEIVGKVEKIMPVSASTFSLVPRDIASGEFTKLDQRFIVKISIVYNPKIRIGMGAEVKIYKDK